MYFINIIVLRVQAMTQSADECPVNHTDHNTPTAKPLSELPVPQGTNGLPIVGDTLEFLFRPKGFADRRRAKFGEVYYANIFGQKTITVSGSAGHQWVFTGENKYLKNRWFGAIRRLLGSRSISVIEGDEHRARRQMHAPHFSYDAMSEFIPVINDIVKRTFKRWAAQSEPVEVVSAMRSLTFEIATAFVFGDADGVDRDTLTHEFETWVTGMFSLSINAPFTPFGKALSAKKRMYDILGQVIAERRASGETGRGVLGTLLRVRDSNGQPLPDEVVMHEIQTMLFAGHETTITANTYLIMFLAQHPNVLKRAQDEQSRLPDETLQSVGGLKNMPYADCIINETLRYYPPVGGVFRVMTQDAEYKGYRVPAGFAVSITPATTHHDPAVWTEPGRFEPERFERGEHKKQPFTFIPFGGGPRLCLGQNFAMTEMRIILAQLVRDYEWELLPDQDLTPRLFPSPTPKKGMQVVFRERQTIAQH
jgi:retinoid hydroxylase